MVNGVIAMNKSLNKIRKCLNKTVKAYSYQLSDDEFNQINDLIESYGRCRHAFYNQYSDINSMLVIKNWRKIRNQYRKNGAGKHLTKIYNFQGKHWVLALQNAFANLDSMWSNTKNKIKSVLKDNDNLNEDQKHLLYFILCFRKTWYEALTDKPVILNKKYQETYKEIVNKLSSDQYRTAINYLKRVTRRYKYHCKAKTTFGKSLDLDQDMYHFGKNNSFTFSSRLARKRFKIKLTGDFKYKKTGNLTVVLDRYKKRIEIHKLIVSRINSLKQRKNKKVGIDKGLATLISVSTENEYGKNFSKASSQFVAQGAKRLANRQKYISRYYLLKHKINVLKVYHTKHAEHKIHKFQKEMDHLQKHHLGKIRFYKHNESCKGRLNSLVNQAVRQFMVNEAPKLFAKEDLTFTKDKQTKKSSPFQRKMNRYLNSWCKGYLNKRLEYLAQFYNIEVKDVNPAYTSQYCPLCGCKFLKRYGKHHELVKCPNCGEMNCNIAAGKNILARLTDPEINLYTPYKKVKKILDARIKTT